MSECQHCKHTERGCLATLLGVAFGLVLISCANALVFQFLINEERLWKLEEKTGLSHEQSLWNAAPWLRPKDRK